MKQKKKKIAVDPGGDGQDYLGGGGETQDVDNVSTSLGPNGRPGSTRTTLLAASFFLDFPSSDPPWTRPVPSIYPIPYRSPTTLLTPIDDVPLMY